MFMNLRAELERQRDGRGMDGWVGRNASMSPGDSFGQEDRLQRDPEVCVSRACAMSGAFWVTRKLDCRHCHHPAAAHSPVS